MAAELIPAISMWQPYASLLFVWDKDRGEMAKAFETRCFALPKRLIGKPVAIHATQSFAPSRFITPALNDLCYQMFGCSYKSSLPRSAIIGIATFAAPRLTSQERRHQPASEIAAGDWSDGDPGKPRWAWPVENAALLQEPIPAKGRQGWWRHPAPEHPRSQPQEGNRG